MSLKLIIAEKPSVAQSIAHVLGATTRKDGYTEGGGFLAGLCGRLRRQVFQVGL